MQSRSLIGAMQLAAVQGELSSSGPQSTKSGVFFSLFLRVVPESLHGRGVLTKIPPTQPGERGFIYKVGERA